MAEGKRELIDTGKDKRFVRRDEKGQFDEVADVGKSLARDRRQHAKKTVPPGGVIAAIRSSGVNHRRNPTPHNPNKL